MTRPVSRKADRAPTWVFRVVEALQRADDFLSRPALLIQTGASPDQLSAALYHLVKRAGVVGTVEQGPETFYYITGQDKRIRSVDERAPEPKGNRRRRKSSDRISV